MRRKTERMDKIFEEIMAENNCQIEELQIVPRYTVMKLQDTKNKEKGNQRGKKRHMTTKERLY